MTIELNPITSGYSTGLINDNFQSLEDYVNDYLLHRDGVETGQPNHMEVGLDMNGNPIYNVEVDLSDGGSLLTIDGADSLYINVAGDAMEGPLGMGSHPLTVRVPVLGNEPARKDQLEDVVSNYQAGDANLQAQLSGTSPLEASAFSEISWHGQTIENSVTIPENMNAWSIGPVMTIAEGQAVSVGSGSYWTLVEGQSLTLTPENFDEGTL